MILVLGGTIEGRHIASRLCQEGYSVLISVVSEYGAGMIPSELPVEVLVGKLDSKGLQHIITQRNVSAVIDATHPYAHIITETAWEVSKSLGLPYIRYERPPAVNKKVEHNIYFVDTYEQAVTLSIELGDTVFLTIGSKNIEPFIRTGKKLNKHVVVRVLPEQDVLEQCRKMGLSSNDIIAKQGPFSLDENLRMLKKYRADVLVTKDSGTSGGTDAKIDAANLLGIPVVVVRRPAYPGIPAVNSVEGIIEILSKEVSV